MVGAHETVLAVMGDATSHADGIRVRAEARAGIDLDMLIARISSHGRQRKGFWGLDDATAGYAKDDDESDPWRDEPQGRRDAWRARARIVGVIHEEDGDFAAGGGGGGDDPFDQWVGAGSDPIEALLREARAYIDKYSVKVGKKAMREGLAQHMKGVADGSVHAQATAALPAQDVLHECHEPAPACGRVDARDGKVPTRNGHTGKRKG